MGRKHRIEYSGAIYHVIQRGNNKSYIFQDEEDKLQLLYLIEKYKEEMKKIDYEKSLKELEDDINKLKKKN